MEQNIEKIENFIAHTIPDMVNVVATVVLMFAIFFSLDGWLAAVGLAVIAVSVILQFSNFMGKKAQEFTRIYFDAQERMSASAVQYVRGMPVVKIFGQSVRSFRQFNAEIEAYKTYALKVCDTYQPGMVAFTVLLNSLVTFFFPIGILLVGGSPGDIALAAVWLFFIVMGPGVASPVYKLMYLGGGTREINEGVVRIDRIFDRRPVPEPAEPRVPTTYDIEFRHVGFSYSNEAEATRTEALRDISFTARQGEITALVGPSGSGKSTVANLIPRFWDVGQGEIRIGGIDIREIATERLMDIVSFVFQETFLFYDTLYENIRTGRPDATHEEVVAAAKAAQCHEFIERLPDGYATRIGDRGVYPFGRRGPAGMRGACDPEKRPGTGTGRGDGIRRPRKTEWKMQQALQHLIRDKTVIIIAHRLSSIVRGTADTRPQAGAAGTIGAARSAEQDRRGIQKDVGRLYRRVPLAVRHQRKKSIESWQRRVSSTKSCKIPASPKGLRTTGSAGHEPGARIAGAMGHGLHGVAGRLERTGHRMRRRCQPRADSQTMPRRQGVRHRPVAGKRGIRPQEEPQAAGNAMLRREGRRREAAVRRRDVRCGHGFRDGLFLGRPSRSVRRGGACAQDRRQVPAVQRDERPGERNVDEPHRRDEGIFGRTAGNAARAAGFADIAVYRREKEELCIVARKQARNDQNGGRR